MDITKTQFLMFEKVRLSGVTNMFDVQTVAQLSGLNKEQILAIMKQYEELKEQYGE